MLTTKQVFKNTFKSSELYEMYLLYKTHKKIDKGYLAEHYGMSHSEVTKRIKLGNIVFQKPMHSWDRNVLNQLRRCMFPRNAMYANYRQFGTRVQDFERIFNRRIGDSPLLKGDKISNLKIYNFYNNILVHDRDVERFDKWLARYL